MLFLNTVHFPMAPMEEQFTEIRCQGEKEDVFAEAIRLQPQ
jgi:hypothetical protein